MSGDAFPRITTDMLDEHADAVAWMCADAPQGLRMEASFPGYLRTMMVTHLAFEWEEQAPGSIRLLPKSLAEECAWVDHACWLAVNDPIVPYP